MEVKNDLFSYDPEIPLLFIKDTYHPMFTAALFTIVKTWKQPKMSTDKGMDKEDVACIYIYAFHYIYI